MDRRASFRIWRAGSSPGCTRDFCWVSTCWFEVEEMWEVDDETEGKDACDGNVRSLVCAVLTSLKIANDRPSKYVRTKQKRTDETGKWQGRKIMK